MTHLANKTYASELVLSRNRIPICALLKDSINLPNGNIYFGQVSSKLRIPHGIGIAMEKTGSCVYEGQWKDGLAHGKGRQISYYMVYEG